MPEAPQKQNLLLWFNYLHALQSACSIDTSVALMDLLTFANSTIVTLLPTTNNQNQFIVEANANPAFHLSVADLTNYKTFRGKHLQKSAKG